MPTTAALLGNWLKDVVARGGFAGATITATATTLTATTPVVP